MGRVSEKRPVSTRVDAIMVPFGWNAEIERLGMLTSIAKFAVLGNDWWTCEICIGYVIA